MIITLEDNVLVADIKRVLKMIRGIASVRVATISDAVTARRIVSLDPRPRRPAASA